MGEHNSFLNDTNLSQLAQTLPQATSTVLHTQPRTRSYPEHAKDVVRTLFDDKERDCTSRSSLGLLSSGYFDRSILSGVSMPTGSPPNEAGEATDMKQGNKRPSQKSVHTDLMDMIGASKESLLSAVFKDRKTAPRSEGSSRTASRRHLAGSEVREQKMVARDQQSRHQETLKDQNGHLSEASLLSESASVASGRPSKHPFDDASQLSYSEFYRVGDPKDSSDAALDEKSRSAFLKKHFDVSELDFSIQEVFGVNNEQFVSAADAESQLAEAEREFEEEHRFEIPEVPPATGPLGEVEIDENDVSYPSFVSVDGNERITISAYLKSRSAPIDRILGHPPTCDFSAMGEDGKGSTGSPAQSIQELVEKELGLGDSSLDRSQDVSLGSSKESSHSSASRAKEHSFKRPLATAPRARSSQIPVTHSALTRGLSTNSADKSTQSLKESSQLASPSDAKLAVSSGTQSTPRSPRSSKQATHIKQREEKSSVGKKTTPKQLREISPSQLAEKDSGSRSRAEKAKAPSSEHRTSGTLSRSSSLDLKKGMDDLSVSVGQSLCKSDGNFATPGKEGADAAFQRSASLEGLFVSPAGTPMVLLPSQFANLSDSGKTSYWTARSSCQSWAVPRGLLLPLEAVQGACKLDLGLVCAGVVHDVAVALLNPTSKDLRYEIRQWGVHIGGREQPETVRLHFPGPHTVSAGCVYEAKGTFLSLSPGTVEVEAGAVLPDEAGDTSVHRMTLGAHVVWPHVSVEPGDGRLSFQGLHFGEQRQSHSQELLVANRSACPVPIILAIVGGEGMFTVRLRRESGGAKQRPALSVSTVLPSKGEGPAAAISFIVECSGLVAKGLNVPAKVEVLLDGSLPAREVLGMVELSASFMPPELSLEGIATDEPVYVGGDGKSSTKVGLRNAGAYPLDVKLVAGPHFHVSPEKATVEAQGCVQVSLRTARTFDGTQAQVTGPSVVEAVLLPQGFRMTLAEVVAIPSQQQPALASPEVVGPSRHRQAAAAAAAAVAGGDGHFRALESTRRVLLWARTHDAPNATKKFELRNPNPGSVIVELTLSGQGKSFFLVKMLNAGGRVSTLNGKTAGTRLAAKETMGVQVTHDPSGASDGEGVDTPPRWAHARLHIRSRCTTAVDTKSVGLYALGGRLRVDLHGVVSYRERCHLVDIGPPLAAGGTARQKITVFNSGDWNACVYIETGPDATGRGVLSVSPCCFVLGCQESKLVSLTYMFEDTGSQGKGKEPILPLHSIRVLYGYEVLRHRAKRAFARPDCKRQPSELMLPFLASFQDENSGDAQVAVSDHLAEEVFLRSVTQMTVAVLSSDATASFLHTSDAASFAALEDTTFSTRLSLPELE
ncbi:uncharacterized protein LOC144179376 isoform X3 [Haemaphysalis longicornis]